MNYGLRSSPSSKRNRVEREVCWQRAGVEHFWLTKKYGLDPRASYQTKAGVLQQEYGPFHDVPLHKIEEFLHRMRQNRTQHIFTATYSLITRREEAVIPSTESTEYVASVSTTTALREQLVETEASNIRRAKRLDTLNEELVVEQNMNALKGRTIQNLQREISILKRLESTLPLTTMRNRNHHKWSISTHPVIFTMGCDPSF